MKRLVRKTTNERTSATVLIAILVLSVLISSGLIGIVPVAHALGTTILSGFDEPVDVAVDASSGNFYVANANNNTIIGFNSNNERIWATAPTTIPGRPEGIGCGNGVVYVAVPSVGAGGAIITLDGDTGEQVTAWYPGVSMMPWDIAVDPTSGDFYVTNPSWNQTAVYDQSWAYRGDLPYPYFNARDIDIDDDGNVFITYLGDPGHVVMFPGGFGGGSPVEFYSGVSPGFSSPRGIAVDGSYVYVAEEGTSRIQKFTTSGAYVGLFGSGFYMPCGIAADSGNVYVADTGSDRMVIYKQASSASVSVTPDPVYLGSEAQISGVVTPAGVYSLLIKVIRPDATSETFGSLSTTSEGQFQLSYVPSSVVGTYTVQVFENVDPPQLLASTSFVAVEPGACALVVSNVVTGGAPPLWDWTYALALFETTVEEFNLPSNGSATFAALEPGTYWVMQTRKFNYTTSTIVDGFEVPNEIWGNATVLTLSLTAGTTTSVVFNNTAIPEAAWAKKANVGDSSTPSMMTYSVPCRRAVPVQVSWDPDIQPDTRIDLVKGRPTKILVNLSDVLPPTGPVTLTDNVAITLTSSSNLFTSLSAATTGQGIKDNNITIFTLNPPSVVGNYTITCTIKYGSTQPPQNTLSQYTTDVSVKETSELALFYSHLYRSDSYGTENAAAFDTMLANTRDFINAVYPVSGVTVDSNNLGIAGAAYEANYLGILKDCQYIAQQAKLIFPNSPNAIGIAIGPDLATGGNYKNYFAYHGAASGKKTAVGVSFGPGVKGVVVLDGYYSTAAHEIGHTFGLYWGVPEQYTIYNPGAPANGFWAEQNEWRSGYDFMGLSQYRSTTSMWVNTSTTFEPLFRSLKTPDDPPHIILVSGIIYDNGTVDLPLEWYSMPYGLPDTVPTGDFAIRFTTAADGTYETSFAAQFFLNLDPGIEAGEDLQENYIGFGTIPVDFAGFAFAIEYPEGTVNIELVDKRNGGDQVIATIDPEDVVSALSAGFGGFLPPIKEDRSRSFKLGSAVPVKFQLKSSGGTFITTAQARLFLSFEGTGPEIPATSVGKSNTGNLFRYDVTSNQYIFNLNTKPLKKGTWQLRVYLGDGTPPKTVKIKLK